MDNEYIAKSKRGEPVNSTASVTRRILAADGNTVKLSLATLFCILMGILVVITSSWLLSVIASGASSAPLALGVLSALSFLILAGGFIFLFLPCVSGVIIFARRTVNGEKPTLGALLEPFLAKNKRKYINSILLPIALMIRMAVIFLPLVLGVISLPLVNDADASFFAVAASGVFLLCFLLAALAVGMYISSYFFFVPYLMVEQNAGFFEAFFLSVRMARRRKRDITLEMLSAVPSVIISVLTLMVLWVFYAAPKILVSYFVFCDRIADFDNE